jgi:predicted nucleotidyltransferase
VTNALLDRALAAIRTHRIEARERGVELLGVVGSVARGEAGPESDVDVVYAIIGKPSLFDLGGILMDIQDDLQRRVDLVDLARIKPRLRKLMERDLVRA